MNHFGWLPSLGLALAMLGCGLSSSSDRAKDGNAVLQAEKCNFADDDGDGLVDEGFPWVVEDPAILHRVDRFSSVGRAAPGGDNTWVVVGTDAVSEPGDRLFALRVDGDARVTHGPTHVLVPHCSNGHAAVAPLGSNFLAVVGSRTWANRPPCPDDGCPVMGAVLDPQLRVVTTAELPIPNYPNVVVTGLACSTTACFAIVGDGVNTAIVRLATSPLALHAQRELGADGALLALSAGDEEFVDVVSVEDGVVRWRRLRASDLSEEGSPVEILAANRLLGASSLTDGGFVLVYTDSTEKQRLARFDAHQQRIHDSGDVGMSLDMVPSGNGIVHVGSPADSLVLATELVRLDGALSPVRSPNNPLRSPAYPSRMSLVLGEGFALLFSANYDGQAVEARRISCATVSP